ncbi:radical SAM family heme chaperone HemW [Ancrocorticia populi]|uniref:radical SAM family heme chaperone HemW n=1 Tax=Ancrocorticia populi TaxID=2175228 RepID=UPI002352D3C8|nr:radical SAM family heme chaperone HemW [Ancrocorticia populi]
MASLPDGEPAPQDGSLPNPDISAGFSAYVHIPFCSVRCGYCDFNTYTNPNFGPGAGLTDFPDSLAREIALSRRVLEGNGPIKTVFFGGGTPTMLDSAQLVAVLGDLKATFGLAANAEITTEANPESVTPESLRELAAGGFTRVSFGMQSAVPRVLSILDRQHRPSRVPQVVRWAREAGLEVSLDLIYGAPGETDVEWRASLEAALALEPDHISAYALTVEPGTKMGGQVRRGEISLPDPDMQADRYEMAAAMLEPAGYHWYEISNWARPGHECAHNLAYWRGSDWWGYGPGAHSHIGGTRFWNVKHPLAYANRLLDGASPAAARELLSATERAEETIMLGIRLAEGIPVPAATGREVIAGLISDELVDPASAFSGTLRLTLRGRLLADSVTRALWQDL